LDTFKYLEKRGFSVTYLPVNKEGIVDLKVLEKSITPETILVSVMYANNEVGTVQPIEEISKILHKSLVTNHRLPILHTDSAAVAEYLPLDVKKLVVDLMTLGSHKFGGPKGVGILYIKKGTKIDPITFGGHHERSLWPGTEAVPLIVGMAEALRLAVSNQSSVASRVEKLRDKLIKGVLEKIPDTILTGHPEKRLADIASFCFKGAEGEAILLRLDAEGIAASSGSACTSGTLNPSHVLLAMGIPAEVAHGSIRFSLGRETTEEEIDYVLEKLPDIIKQLRQMAPKF
jgi:cysteine desulfurase